MSQNIRNLRAATKPRVFSKTTAYRALHILNYHADAVIEQLNRLRELGIFETRFQRESSVICGVTIEETRAWINFEAVQVLRDREERDRARFGRVRRKSEKKYEDPQDVVLMAKRLKRAATVGKRRRARL